MVSQEWDCYSWKRSQTQLLFSLSRMPAPDSRMFHFGPSMWDGDLCLPFCNRIIIRSLRAILNTTPVVFWAWTSEASLSPPELAGHTSWIRPSSLHITIPAWNVTTSVYIYVKVLSCLVWVNNYGALPYYVPNSFILHGNHWKPYQSFQSIHLET